MNIIELKNVSKSFGSRQILDEINLTIKQGEFIILSGENGAGKTTIISLILGLQKADKGEIEVFGYSPEDSASRLKLGCMLQKARVPDYLTVEELINLIRSYYPQPLSIEEILKKANLEALRYNKVSELSGGQERAVYFALAIAGNPDLLILDEPTRDLDINATAKFWQQVEDFIKQGKTIIVISHIASDREKIANLATRILKLANGKLEEEKTEKFEDLLNSATEDKPIIEQKQPYLSSLWGQLKVEVIELIRKPGFLGPLVLLNLGVIILGYVPAEYVIFGLMFVALITIVVIVIQTFGVKIATERTQGWIKLLRVTPLPPWIYLTAKVIIAVLLFVLTLGLMFGLTVYSLNLPQSPNTLIAFFLSLIIGSLPFAVIGFAIGYLFNPTIISSAVTLVSFVLLIATTIPFPNMPEWLKNWMSFSPFYHYGELAMWAGNIQDILGHPYDGRLGLHIEWLIWTTCAAILVAQWAYKNDKSLQ